MAVLDLQKLLKALHSSNVRFVLVGGVAGIGHGMNYITTDLDICYLRSKENYSAIIKALKPAKPKLRTKEEPVPFLFDEKTLELGLNFTLVSDWGDIDLLGEIQGVGKYEDLLPNVSQFEFYEVPIDTISLDDLIKAKQKAGRTKDKLHLLELEAIKEILKGQK